MIARGAAPGTRTTQTRAADRPRREPRRVNALLQLRLAYPAARHRDGAGVLVAAVRYRAVESCSLREHFAARRWSVAVSLRWRRVVVANPDPATFNPAALFRSARRFLWGAAMVMTPPHGRRPNRRLRREAWSSGVARRAADGGAAVRIRASRR
jgi:hypothetical protein